MKTSDEKNNRGGRREGSGRKRLNSSYDTVMLSARLTEEQKATFDMLGGAQWLRAELDKIAGTPPPVIDVWK